VRWDGPRIGALVELGADLRGHLRVHQRLGQNPDPFTQNVGVLFRQELAHETS